MYSAQNLSRGWKPMPSVAEDRLRSCSLHVDSNPGSVSLQPLTIICRQRTKLMVQKVVLYQTKTATSTPNPTKRLMHRRLEVLRAVSCRQDRHNHDAFTNSTRTPEEHSNDSVHELDIQYIVRPTPKHFSIIQTARLGRNTDNSIRRNKSRRASVRRLCRHTVLVHCETQSPAPRPHH